MSKEITLEELEKEAERLREAYHAAYDKCREFKLKELKTDLEIENKCIIIGYESDILDVDITNVNNLQNCECTFMKIKNVWCTDTSLFIEGFQFSYSNSEEYSDCRWFDMDGFRQREFSNYFIEFKEGYIRLNNVYSIRIISLEEFKNIFWAAYSSAARQFELGIQEKEK